MPSYFNSFLVVSITYVPPIITPATTTASLSDVAAEISPFLSIISASSFSFLFNKYFVA